MIGTRSARSKWVVRISRGSFEPEKYHDVLKFMQASETSLRPAIRSLRGLLYYHVGVDRETSTVVNVSIWKDEEAAKQMQTLGAMLTQRPILEGVGVKFDRPANYEPLWTIGSIASSEENLD